MQFKNDTERLDWLEKQNGCGLISDDFSRWAVAGNGMQNVPSDPAQPSDIDTTFWIEARDWRPSVREAIDAAAERYGH